MTLAVAMLVGLWGCDGGRAQNDEGVDPIDAMRREGDVAGLSRVVRAGSRQDADRAIMALANVGGPKAIEVLLDATEDSRPAIRERAAVALAGPAGRNHADRLAGMLRQDKAPMVRAAAATALGRSRDCTHVPELIEAMDDSHPTVRERAQWAVVRICGVEPGFETTDPVEKRRKAIAFYRAFWARHAKTITEHNKRQLGR